MSLQSYPKDISHDCLFCSEDDALYQYKSKVPISRREADILFRILLKELDLSGLIYITFLLDYLEDFTGNGIIKKLKMKSK